ncbi:MAG: type II toxin-antitoxin system Phd/YefM family antitoxin [Verrucomicrobiia bacterium]|tara:strand:+ start:1888 stop:2115 length:228 start_codon:yes stop_codon:yes gene_type:complete
MQIGTFEAKNKLSSLLDRAENGEVIEITRRGKPIAELRAATGAAKPTARFGSEKNLIEHIDEDFSSPLEDFEGYQ